MNQQLQLFEIAIGRTSLRWTDDTPGHGTMFVSLAMAQRTFNKHKAELDQTGGAIIVPCELDDDLAQMGNLYHE